MDLELKRKKINVKLDGQNYPMTVPTLREADKYQHRAKAAEKEGKTLDLLFDFLGERGLPKDVIETLEVDHVNMLVEHLLGIKKN